MLGLFNGLQLASSTIVRSSQSSVACLAWLGKATGAAGADAGAGVAAGIVAGAGGTVGGASFFSHPARALTMRAASKLLKIKWFMVSVDQVIAPGATANRVDFMVIPCTGC